MVTEILLGLIWLLLGIILCFKWTKYTKDGNATSRTRNIVCIMIILLSPLVFLIAIIGIVIISDWD